MTERTQAGFARLSRTERKQWADRIAQALTAAGLSVVIEEEKCVVDYGSSTAPDDVDWSTRRRTTRYNVLVDDAAAVARMKLAKKANPPNMSRPQADIDQHVLSVWLSAAVK